MVRPIAIVSLSLVIASLTLGLSLSQQLPETPDDALNHVSDLDIEVSDEYVWFCPTEYGIKECTLRMEIPEDVFEHSMHRNVFRTGTVFNHSPSSFVLPDDEFIQIIAQHIDTETEGLPDNVRAKAALWFVQCAISYAHDSDLYGTENFWAFPVETLYLHRGDCEDTSVLLASILEAMGFATVLLDYPGHMAVGVELDPQEGFAYALDDGTYSFCETTSVWPTEIGTCVPSVSPDRVWHPGDEDGVRSWLNTAFSGYRYLFQRILGI